MIRKSHGPKGQLPPRRQAIRERESLTANSRISSFPCLVAGIYFLLSCLGMFLHEPWRDEYQAWLIARDSHSIFELMRNLRYEGHPGLWHFILWILASVTHHPAIMKVVHILITTASVFLLNRCAPFSKPDKILFTFGYYSHFEFNLISRSYSLGFLLIVTFLVLYENRHKHCLLISFVLFLLANTHLYGLIISVLLAGVLLTDHLASRRAGNSWKLRPAELALCAIVIGAGWTLSAFQIYPPSDSGYPVPFAQQFNWDRTKLASWRLMTAYFPFPQFPQLQFWNSSFLESMKQLPDGRQIPDVAKMYLAVPLATFAVFVVSFLRKPIPLLFYASGTIALVGVYYYTLLICARHTSHLFVILMASIWLADYYQDLPVKNVALMKLSSLGKRVGKYMFTATLAVGLAGGLVAYVTDLKYHFSASAAAADYLVQSELAPLPAIGVVDYAISPLAAILNRKIFYLERFEEGSFIVWDKKRKENVGAAEIIQAAQTIVQQGERRVLLLSGKELTYADPADGKSKPIVDLMITGELRLQLLKVVPPGIVPDEKYFIYLVEQTTARQ
jgi:hypothetical protein